MTENNSENCQPLLRRLPAIDRLLNQPSVQALNDIPASLVLEAARQTIAELRQQILDGGHPENLEATAVASRVVTLARELAAPSLRPLINATGTLLHTNLGRAPLSSAALAAIQATAAGYSNLEFDLENGQRGHRFSHVESLLCRLTGAEAAMVVNNNAGAVLLALSGLAAGREAIVSRGELVEIGGSFRIPEVMAAGGVRLCEVGATNKTHLHDYRSAIGDQTGLLLKVHTSNYRIVGFSEAVTTAELVALGHEFDLPVLEDLGSGMLLDLTAYGLPAEPTVADTVAAGVDLVSFSGDKLLGGPQAGLIVGRAEAVDRLRRHPLARALRIDKLSLAALEATLALYLEPKKALAEIPVLQMLQADPEQLRRRCRNLARKLNHACGAALKTHIIPENSRVGGGALPLCELPGFALALRAERLPPERLAARLRQAAFPVIGRVQDDQLLLNPRTFSAAREQDLLTSLLSAVASS